MGKRTWTQEEIDTLINDYKNDVLVRDISKKLNKSIGAVKSKIISLELPKLYIKKNNINFKAAYQDYDWCYERYINRNMTMEQMAEEANCSLRVIKKWCSEKHRLNLFTYSENKKLTELQKQLIMFSLLGDGHITNNNDRPIYIESHAENQKEYLFWKYNILKDICSNIPKYYPAEIRRFKNGDSLCQPGYRFNTRIIDDLKDIKNMSSSEIIMNINEFGLSIFLLDDGDRTKCNWRLCMAEYTEEEKQLFIDTCKEKFGLLPHIINADNRYLLFNSEDSREIDNIILRNIPNNLDIVQYRIINNKTTKPIICNFVNYNNEKIGLARFCRTYKLNYEKCKKYLETNNLSEIDGKLLFALKENNYETICQLS